MYLGLERVRVTDSPFTVSFLYTLSYSSFLLFQREIFFKIIVSFFILNFVTLLDYRYHSRISLQMETNTLNQPAFYFKKEAMRNLFKNIHEHQQRLTYRNKKTFLIFHMKEKRLSENRTNIAETSSS